MAASSSLPRKHVGIRPCVSWADRASLAGPKTSCRREGKSERHRRRRSAYRPKGRCGLMVGIGRRPPPTMFCRRPVTGMCVRGVLWQAAKTWLPMGGRNLPQCRNGCRRALHVFHEGGKFDSQSCEIISKIFEVSLDPVCAPGRDASFLLAFLGSCASLRGEG